MDKEVYNLENLAGYVRVARHRGELPAISETKEQSDEFWKTTEEHTKTVAQLARSFMAVNLYKKIITHDYSVDLTVDNILHSNPNFENEQIKELKNHLLYFEMEGLIQMTRSQERVETRDKCGIMGNDWRYIYDEEIIRFDPRLIKHKEVIVDLYEKAGHWVK